jgi:uncharacterized RDD family membrane protein YckC
MICRNHVEIAERVRRCSRCGGTYCPDCLVVIQDGLFCASCKTEQLLDVRSGVDRMRLTPARFWPRFAAQLIDGMIVGVASGVVAVGIVALVIFASRGNETALPFVFIAYLPIYIFPILYEGMMLTAKRGQTLGKMALHLRVVRPDGSDITSGQAWGRAAIRLGFGITCLAIVDYLAYFFTNERTTLHDMVAGTRVIESN